MRRIMSQQRLRLRVAILVAIGLFVQMLLPPPTAFAGPPDPFLASGSICHVGGFDDGYPGRPPLPVHHNCCQCVLCQTAPVVFLPPDAIGRLFVPVAIPLQLVRQKHHPLAAITHLAYASRAPPRIGRS
jgi:hypothetical protein